CLGTSTIRGLTRNLAHAKKRRHDKEIIVEINECVGRLVGEDSQELITKGGCILQQFAKFDGTTWKHQPKELKDDIISKRMENLNYDGNKTMESAIQRQLEVSSSNSPAEICMQKLRGIPGHIKGWAAATKLIVASKKLQMEIETESKRADKAEIQSAIMSAKLAA
ncbi:hypothetical protein RJ641_018880, partial [Dillenia turbinata]